MSEHGHGDSGDEPDYFEPAGWEQRYAGADPVWSGSPNPQLVTEASALTAGTTLDVGCGEGGDVIWLASHGWTVTGADFSANGLARARRHAEEAGVPGRCDWWQVDARTFDPAGRVWDLVTSHYLHPPEGGIVDIVGRLARAVAPGGHLLVVGHEPGSHGDGPKARAMFWARDLVPGLPDGFEVVVAEQRPRSVVRNGETFDIGDSVLLARRR